MKEYEMSEQSDIAKANKKIDELKDTYLVEAAAQINLQTNRECSVLLMSKLQIGLDDFVKNFLIENKDFAIDSSIKIGGDIKPVLGAEGATILDDFEIVIGEDDEDEDYEEL